MLTDNFQQAQNPTDNYDFLEPSEPAPKMTA